MWCSKRAFAALIWVAGCGVPEDALLVELSEKDTEKLCEAHIDDFEDTTVDCDGVDVTLEKGTLEECIDTLGDVSDDCGATVGDWLGCADSIHEDPCVLAGELPSSCDTYVECFE
jgi:hypothetical protein